jgi:hypothetical protein
MMNFGDGDAQIVEFSPAFPYQGAFFFRTNQQGSWAKMPLSLSFRSTRQRRSCCVLLRPA